jgi:hypothetical protein
MPSYSKSIPKSWSVDSLIERRLKLYEKAVEDQRPPSIEFVGLEQDRREPDLKSPSVARITLSQPGSAEPTPAPSTLMVESEHLDVSETGTHELEVDGQRMWISGSALMCACPDCHAPTTIRLWLRLADCWRCQTSVSLTEQQVQSATQLREKSQPQPVEAPAVPAKPVVEIIQAEPNRLPLPAPPPPPINAMIDAADGAIDGHSNELNQLARRSIFAGMLRHGFRSVPAWLVSLVIHFVILLILALIMLGDRAFLPESITLSSFLSSDDTEGGELVIDDPAFRLQDDLAAKSKMDMNDQEKRNVLQKANRDALEIQQDMAPASSLPNLDAVKKNITTAAGPSMSFATRDPRVRSEMVRKQGGTTLTEAAVSRGLRWLASVQNKDGGWSLKNYSLRDDNKKRSDVMATSLALLPMLGAGQTHEYGHYKDVVAGGLKWLMEHQKPNGDMRSGNEGNQGMYAHGQATIVLCEALALTGDQQFIEPAQKAIRFIEAAQHGKGGWRYRPNTPGDTSVLGWQMMALQSAKACGEAIDVDESTLKLADYFLDQVTAKARFSGRKTELPDGSVYGYMPQNRKPSAALTAEAILCRMYLGWEKNDPRLDMSIKWLLADHLPSSRKPNLYYWYYGTQTMHHYGGPSWRKWNDRVRPLLLSMQKNSGRFAGSWSPSEFEWGARGGRIYTTSLAVCSLEVYYRHLPIFHKIELD